MIAQADESGTQEPALESITGGDSFTDLGAVGRFGFTFHKLMALRVERIGVAGDEGSQADPASGIMASVLKVAELFDEFGLARALGAEPQGKNMVEHPDQHLK